MASLIDEAVAIQQARDPTFPRSPPNESYATMPRRKPDEGLSEGEAAAMDRHMFEFGSIYQAELEFNTGSVLAVVHFPRDPGTDCSGFGFRPVYRMRLDYQRLVKTSSAKLLDMLAPENQQRIRRRLKLQELPEGVDYVLDLTPPSEGTELADLTASLWLPKGAKIWHLAAHYAPDPVVEFGSANSGYHKRPLTASTVAAGLVLGHDDRCTCLGEYRGDQAQLWKANSEGVPGILSEVEVPAYRQIADYCGIRHRTNILRILRAINGADILINSATRMWTLVRVAVDLEVTSLIRDSIAQWFLAPPNSKFIEIFPEDSFKVALALQIPDVLVASFKILVNDFAMDHAAGDPSARSRPTTWIGRKRGDYGDMPQDPIENAGIALYERIKAMLDLLRADDALERLDIPAWDHFLAMGSLIQSAREADPSPLLSELERAYQLIFDSFRQCFKQIVDESLKPSPDPASHTGRLIKAQRRHYIAPDQLVPLNVIQESSNDYQKALCSVFWSNLKKQSSEITPTKRFCGLSLFRMERDFNSRLQRVKTEIESVEDQDRSSSLDALLNSSYTFHLESLLEALNKKMDSLRTGIGGSDWDREGQGHPLVLSDHIIQKLDENELKFLPMWAGGWDDGTGGVFQEQIPPTEMGPSEPGPSYHTGWTVPTDTDAGASVATTTAGNDTETMSDFATSELDFDHPRPRSLDVQDSASATTATRTVGTASELFVINDLEFNEAMYSVPAEHQPAGRALATYVEEDYGANSFYGSSTYGSTVSVMNEDEGEEDAGILSDNTLSAGSAPGSDSDFEVVERL